MKKIISTLLCFGAIALIAYACFKFVENNSEIPQQPTQENIQKDGVYQRVIGFSLEEYDIANDYTTITKAEELVVRPSRIGFFKTPLIKETILSNPQVIFLQKNKEVSRITAHKAKLDLANKRLFLQNNVQLKTSDGKLLLSEHMTLDYATRTILVRDRFKIIDGENHILGVGITSDIKLEQVSIQQTR
jgi:LPS export ABC transporter protein LptC